MLRVLSIGILLCLSAAAPYSIAQANPPAQDLPQQLRNRALVLEQQGKNAEAEEAWHEIAKAEPNSPEAYAHLGLLAARQQHYKEAVPFYRKALELGPPLPGLRLNLGLALFKSGALKQSLDEFAPLLKSAPAGSAESQRLALLTGMAHYGLGEYAEAVPYLKAAAAADGQNLQLRLALAHSCLWSKQYQCVMDAYHEILTLNAESAEADMLAGEALDGMKEHEGAIEMFRAAIQANPKEPEAHFGLGYLLWTQQQYAAAAGEFEAELANDSGHVQAMIYLADSEIKMNQNEKAKLLLEKAGEIDAGQGLQHLDLGIVYAEAGHNEDALRELVTAEKLIPRDVDVHWRLGRLYKTLGNIDLARTELQKAGSLQKEEDQSLRDRIANAQPKSADAPQSQ